MCTYISNSATVIGAGKGASGWFRVNQATVGFDHPTFTSAEHAILIDFTSRGEDLSARVAVELDLESGRALLATLTETIRAAEASGVE
ncbi:MAG TPA: DUF6295 family protein [Solirubrobacteraceae bacterium]|nr:DUF6295 family protein [Solirubrobacteraceae bacterium]